MPETQPYRRVLALISFDSADESIVRKAVSLARLNCAELAFLHLVEPDVALDGGYPAPNAGTDATAFEAGALRRLAFLATRLGAGEAVCLARCGPARQSFWQVSREWQPDLVVSARDYTFLSGSHDMLVLGRRAGPASGRLKRLAGWLASQLQLVAART